MLPKRPGEGRMKSPGEAGFESGSGAGASGASANDPESGAQTIAAAGRSKLEPALLSSGLHIVATPIGNMGDITLRAISTLGRADIIACEDTRVTGRLLKAHGITTPMLAYHDHNAERVRPKLIERLEGGESVALVSDAGTPLISDPGYRLVRDAVAAGVAVTAIPGPSAALTALVVSGLPTDRFFFAGFLPSRSAARRTALVGLAGIDATLVFLESPRRLAASLADMAAALGERETAVARELTKLHEEVRRGSLAGLAAHYAEAGAPRGETTVIVGPPPAAAPADGAALDRLLAAALDTMSVRDAAAAVAAATGAPRRRVYGRALELSAERHAGRPDGE